MTPGNPFPFLGGTAAAALCAYDSTERGRSKLITSGEKGNSGGFMTTSNRTRNRGPELDEDVRHCCKIAFRCGWGMAGVCPSALLSRDVG
jgi:hypothetical protein